MQEPPGVEPVYSLTDLVPEALQGLLEGVHLDRMALLQVGQPSELRPPSRLRWWAPLRPPEAAPEGRLSIHDLKGFDYILSCLVLDWRQLRPQLAVGLRELVEGPRAHPEGVPHPLLEADPPLLELVGLELGDELPEALELAPEVRVHVPGVDPAEHVLFLLRVRQDPRELVNLGQEGADGFAKPGPAHRRSASLDGPSEVVEARVQRQPLGDSGGLLHPARGPCRLQLLHLLLLSPAPPHGRVGADLLAVKQELLSGHRELRVLAVQLAPLIPGGRLLSTTLLGTYSPVVVPGPVRTMCYFYARGGFQSTSLHGEGADVECQDETRVGRPRSLKIPLHVCSCEEGVRDQRQVNAPQVPRVVSSWTEPPCLQERLQLERGQFLHREVEVADHHKGATQGAEVGSDLLEDDHVHALQTEPRGQVGHHHHEVVPVDSDCPRRPLG